MFHPVRASVRHVAALALVLPCLASAQPAPSPDAPAPPPAATQVPDDLPRYEHAAVVSSMSSPERGTIVTLRSGDDPATILAWYAAELAKRGWTVERHGEARGQHLLSALLGGRKASLMITTQVSATNAEHDESQILLVVTEER